MKPVSRMISRISVKGTCGNEFQRLEPSAQRTFLLTGRRVAAWAIEPARRVIAVRRVILAPPHIMIRFRSKVTMLDRIKCLTVFGNLFIFVAIGPAGETACPTLLDQSFAK